MASTEMDSTLGTFSFVKILFGKLEKFDRFNLISFSFGAGENVVAAKESTYSSYRTSSVAQAG